MVMVFRDCLTCFRSCAATAADDTDDCQEDASENAENDDSDNRSDITLSLCAADTINSASILTLTRWNPRGRVSIIGHASVSDLIVIIAVVVVVVVVIVGGDTLNQNEKRHRAEHI